MSTRQRVTLLSGLAVVGLLIVLVRDLTPASVWRPKPPSPLPADRSPFVAGVKEPITIVSGFEDNHSNDISLAFKDAAGVVRSLQMEAPSSTIIHLGPDSGGDGPPWRPIPMTGDEARSLLGLLERWVKSTPNGPVLDFAGAPTDASGEECAIEILHRLRRGE